MSTASRPASQRPTAPHHVGGAGVDDGGVAAAAVGAARGLCGGGGGGGRAGASVAAADDEKNHGLPAFASLYGDAADAPQRDPEPMLPVGIMFTSGTTSRPKAVVHTHANALWAGRRRTSF